MINLDKGNKISLDKEFPGLKDLRLGVGWYPEGYVPRRFRKSNVSTATTTEVPQKKGFFNKLGEVLQGKARIGDAVNAAVDSIGDAVNSFGDSIPTSTDCLKGIDVDTSIAAYSNGRFVASVNFSQQSAFGGAIRHGGDNLTGIANDMEADKEYIKLHLSKLPSEVDEIIMFVQIFQARTRNQHFGKVGGGFARLSNDNNGEELAFFNLSDKYDKCEGIYLTRIYKHNGEWKFQALGDGVRNASHVQDMISQWRS